MVRTFPNCYFFLPNFQILVERLLSENMAEQSIYFLHYFPYFRIYLGLWAVLGARLTYGGASSKLSDLTDI